MSKIAQLFKLVSEISNFNISLELLGVTFDKFVASWNLPNKGARRKVYSHRTVVLNFFMSVAQF